VDSWDILRKGGLCSTFSQFSVLLKDTGAVFYKKVFSWSADLGNTADIIHSRTV